MARPKKQGAQWHQGCRANLPSPPGACRQEAYRSVFYRAREAQRVWDREKSGEREALGMASRRNTQLCSQLRSRGFIAKLQSKEEKGVASIK